MLDLPPCCQSRSPNPHPALRAKEKAAFRPFSRGEKEKLAEGHNQEGTNRGNPTLDPQKFSFHVRRRGARRTGASANVARRHRAIECFASGRGSRQRRKPLS